MKKGITLILFVFTWLVNFSQTVPPKDCLKIKDGPVVYVPGFKDCNYNRGVLSFRINPVILKDGFELKVTDTTIRIVSFQLTFDYGEELITMSSTGSKIIPRNDSIVSLNKIVKSGLITIDDIRVIKDSFNRKVPSLLLYCIEE